MQRKTLKDMLEALTGQVDEVFPWDLQDDMAAGVPIMLVDVRCPPEYQQARIPGSINVPRGVLEQSVDWGYEETVPELVEGRERRIVLICRSGNRSLLAAHTLQQMGFGHVQSLRTGIKGWNDNEQPMEDGNGRALALEAADTILENHVKPEQLGPGVTRQPDKIA